MTTQMAELPPGAVIAGCRVESTVGRGGMGVVYRATQLSLDRTVAVKAIAPELASNPDFRERFKRESRIAASIEHPNVIPVHEAGEWEGLLYLIMRYVDGIDLRALIAAQGPLDPDRASRLVGDVAVGLAAAHRKGLIHRDVKPANVLIDLGGGEEHAYVTDFGIARDVTATTAITRTGSVVGTPDYMAPERLQDRGEADSRSDVYALGCVLFEALTGSVPFPRDTEMGKLYAHIHDRVPSVRELRPELPAALDGLVQRAMAKDPSERPSSAAELAEALRGQAGTPPAAPDAPLAPTISSSPGTTRATERLPGRPRTGVLMASLAGIGGAVALALVLASGGGGSSAGAAGDPIPVGHEPAGIAVDPSGVWVANSGDGTVTRIDPRTRRRSGRPIRVGPNPDSVAIGLGAVWVTLTGGAEIVGIDPRTRTRQESQDVKTRPEGIAVGEGKIWIANSGDATVGVVEPNVGGFATPVGSEPTGVALGGGKLWVTDPSRDAVWRLHAVTGRRTGAKIPVGSKPLGVAVGAGHVWVVNSGDDTVSRLDLESGRQVGRPTHVGSGPSEVAFGEDAIWVTNRNDGTLTRIDPNSGKVRGDPIKVGSEPVGVAVGLGRVWVANFGSDTVTPVEP